MSDTTGFYNPNDTSVPKFPDDIRWYITNTKYWENNDYISITIDVVKEEERRKVREINRLLESMR